MCNKELSAIIKEIKGQDMSRFGELYGVCDRLILFYAKKLGYEDAAQELTVFLLELIYEIDIKKFKADGSDTLKRYLAVSLRNQYINLSKRNSKYRAECEELFDNSGAEAYEFDTRIALTEGLKLLSEKQKFVIISRYVYGFSDAETADRLCISRQSVHGLLLRGLEILRGYYGVN